MAKNIVIVESPAKAKTISGFLGKDFLVESSFGHIRDLPKNKMGIDIEHGFTPEYIIPADKKKRVSLLKKLVADKPLIWLATDEDREGEAIAWHLKEALKLEDKRIRRIVFHEITPEALQQAMAKPRKLDMHLVDAQQARRVLDRLVGYELSPILWRKIRPRLSAGRVQSVAVRLIVNREKEIGEFKPSSFFKLTANLKTGDNRQINAILEQKIKQEQEADAILRQLQKESRLTVTDISAKDGRRQAPPPFTTSTLQQTAASRLGYSVRQTMNLAQRLYESGTITYMRTDSLALSEGAITAAKEFIAGQFGAKYSKPTQYKTKSKGAQEAHEAIRPTSLSRQQVGDDRALNKLYRLIRSRFLASQMSPAIVSKTKITVSGANLKLTASGEVLKFTGWMAAYESPPLKDKPLPQLTKGDKLTISSAEAVQHLEKHPPRYTEASLVRKLEELGIGRPSTYAPTISTIQDRGYVVKDSPKARMVQLVRIQLKQDEISRREEAINIESQAKKLLPTDTAVVVNDFLERYFADIIDYEFTAKIERKFDLIAMGKSDWLSFIKSFYRQFHKLIEATKSVSRQQATQAKALGRDPDSGRTIYVRYGRYGPMLQRGEATDEEKPDFAPLPSGKTIDTVTLEDALKMFTLPRVIAKVNGEELRANIGRYGPYVQLGSTFASLKDEAEVFSINQEEALKLIQDKTQQQQKSEIKRLGQYIVKRGRYGPYVTDGKLNVKIPKDITPEAIKIDQIEQLFAEKKARKRPKRR